MNIQRKTIASDEAYLRQISEEISLEDENLSEYLKMLEQFCLENECFALAAVQIGIPKRIIYLKNTTLDIPIEQQNYNEAKILINPFVISQKGHTKYWEACVSCLDNIGLVNRPYELVVQYYDQEGILHTETFQGFESTVLSHELDHLDGILHMDIAEQVLQMSKEERTIFREKHPYEIISKTDDYNLNLERKNHHFD